VVIIVSFLPSNVCNIYFAFGSKKFTCLVNCVIPGKDESPNSNEYLWLNTINIELIEILNPFTASSVQKSTWHVY
jgi:hypothetical protein